MRGRDTSPAFPGESAIQFLITRLSDEHSPLLVRRGGCGINKKVGVAHLSAADGVVAHTLTYSV
jgi:hypothetical protein